MSVTTAEAPRACPQCALTMAHLVLQSHGPRPVVVDHCAACRLVWFDALESVRLAGLGWVHLLRELQRSTTGAPPPRSLQLACPVCGESLKPVHNLTRFGRFPALECPQRHGHLHGHGAALAERGLVRPLLGPEKRALAEERRRLDCLNCGAPSDGGSERCSYCHSPLMVIDLPRLAHALRQRPGHWGPSPAPEGVPLAWACRGCGQALDPSRQAACPQCGHGVVVPSLLDITPLLDAVESELRQAANHPHRPRPPRAARSWRDTGLGMIERFMRPEEPDESVALRTVLTLVFLLIFWWVAWR